MDPITMPEENVSPIGRRKSMLPPIGGVSSINGVLSSRRVIKKTLLSRNSEANISLPAVQLQPTYRMEPTTNFKAYEARKIIKNVLEKHLDGFQYNGKSCHTLSTLLSDDIKDQVKNLNYGRYKVIACVVMGEKKDQGLMVASRCAWDLKTDTFASYTYSNKTMFCTASVYGVFLA